MPGINDEPEQVEAILSLAADAGATSVGGITLHLRGEVRGIFLDWLRSQRPDLVPRYEELYARGAYAPKAERARIEGVLRRGRTRFRSFTRSGPGRTDGGERATRGASDRGPGGASGSAGIRSERGATVQGALF